MAVPYYGDFAEDSTVRIPFNTFDSNDPQASATITNLVDADLKVHKDGGLTQIATDGATISIDYDTITGNHYAVIDTSAHADYSTGSEYAIRMEGTTVDAGTINAWLGAWSIERSGGALALIKAGNLGANVTQIGGDTQSATDLKDFADAGYDPATNKVQGVVLVDTTTTNTDMRGTDSAATATALATAQTDLDTITGSDGVTLATAQGLYAPAKAGDSMDVLSISGDTTAADNLELQYDTTGLTGDTFPATQAQVGNLSAGTAAISVTAESFTKSGAEPETLTYTATHALDGSVHKVEDVAGAIDCYYQFDVGTEGVPTEFRWDGYCNIKDDIFDVYAYNYTTPAYEQLGTIIGIGGTTVSTELFPTTISHVGTGANLGKVRFRITTSSGAAVGTDRLLCSYAVVPTARQTKGSVVDATPAAGNFDTDLTQADGHWDDALVTFTSGTLATQSRPISAYLNANGNMTFDSGVDQFTVAPANGDTFVINHDHIHPIGQLVAGLVADPVIAELTTQGDTNETKIDTLTTTVGTAGAGLTDLGGMSTTMKAEVNAEADTALTDYDPPTNTEMEARTPTAAQLAYIVANATEGKPVTFSGTGTTTSGTLALVDGASPNATDDQYKGRLLLFNSGTLDECVTDITAYNGTTKVATVTAVPVAITSSHTARLL